jgi:hypothetical protein
MKTKAAKPKIKWEIPSITLLDKTAGKPLGYIDFYCNHYKVLIYAPHGKGFYLTGRNGITPREFKSIKEAKAALRKALKV